MVYNKNSKEMFQAKKDKTCNGKVDPPSVCPFDRAKEYCEHESESSAKFYKKECPVMCNTCPTTQAPTTQAPTMSPDFKQKFEDFIVQTNTKIELRKNFNTPSTQKLVTISNKLKDLETVYAKKDYVDDLVSSETQMNTYILRKYGNQYGVHQDELNDYLKKADLNSEDLQKLKTFYSEGYSKKKDYAKSEQLDDYATQEQLDSYARKKDLPNMDLYAKKEQLANYANKNDLNDTKINSLYRGLFKIGFLPGATGVTRIEKNFKKQLLNNYVKTKNLPNTDTEDLVKQEELHNLEARAATQDELLSYATQKQLEDYTKLKDLETVYAKKDYIDDLVSSETQMNTYILRKYGNQYGVHQDELNDYLKKADLNSEDLQKLKTFYSEGYSKKKDYAKSEQLDDYATQEQLDSYARKKDLPNMDLYAKKEQLANYANKNDLNDTKINSLYRGLFKIGFLPGATGVTRIEKNFKKQLLNNYVKTKNLPNTDTEDLVKQEVLHNLEARAATQYELLSYVKQKQLEDYTKLKDLETIYAKEDDVMDEYERVYTNFKKTRDENSYVTNENLKNNYVNKNDFNSELYSKSDNFKNLEKQIKDSKKNTKEDIDSLKNNLNIIDKDLQGDLITNVDLLKENTNIMQNNLINFNNDVFSSINYSDNIPICINPDKNKNDTSFDYCSEHIKNKYISAQNFKKNK